MSDIPRYEDISVLPTTTQLPNSIQFQSDVENEFSDVINQPLEFRSQIPHNSSNKLSIKSLKKRLLEEDDNNFLDDVSDGLIITINLLDPLTGSVLQSIEVLANQSLHEFREVIFCMCDMFQDDHTKQLSFLQMEDALFVDSEELHIASDEVSWDHAAVQAIPSINDIKLAIKANLTTKMQQDQIHSSISTSTQQADSSQQTEQTYSTSNIHTAIATDDWKSA